jgi:hypothetical protein
MARTYLNIEDMYKMIDDPNNLRPLKNIDLTGVFGDN